MESKAEIRLRLRARRALVSVEESAAAGAAIAARLAAMPAFFDARTVGCYLSLEQEVATATLLRLCREQGQAVVVPAFDRDRRIYDWTRLAPDAALGWGPMRVPQPAAPAWITAATLDLVLVPGVAFDLAGNRIGHGAGHYDRLLAAARPDCVKVGVAFAWQILPSVPSASHDVRMDWLLTPEQTLACLIPRATSPSRHSSHL